MLVTIGLVGCAERRPAREKDDHLRRISQPLSTSPTELAKEIARTDHQMEEAASARGTLTDIDDHPETFLELNASVQRWVDYFTGPKREVFSRFLKRGSRFRKLVEKSLVEEGVPKEFYYLAMIESGFATHATSHARAVGIWQFIPGTAERYGLRAGPSIDERRDPERASRAAAQYLRDLHNVFGSWRLAMAGYNAGENRILSAIMRGKTRDFWTLAEKKVLPKETMEYVPKFFAAALIGSDPEKYGFPGEHEGEDWEVETVSVPSPVRLASVSSETRLPLAVLKELNPHLLQGITPANTKEYALNFPKGVSSEIQSSVRRLKVISVKPPRRQLAAQPPRLRRVSSAKKTVAPSLVVYRVKRGDTLSRISEQFRVPISRLRKLNGLKGHKLYSGQKLKIKPSFL